PRPFSTALPAPRAPFGLIAMLGVLATGMIVAACGGSSSSSTKPAAPTRSDSAMAFSRCMREHGVKDFPNPEISNGRATLRVKTGGARAGPDNTPHHGAPQEPHDQPT